MRFMDEDKKEFDNFLSGTSEFEDHPLYGRMDHKATVKRVNQNIVEVDGVKGFGDPKLLDFYFGKGDKK